MITFQEFVRLTEELWGSKGWPPNPDAEKANAALKNSWWNGVPFGKPTNWINQVPGSRTQKGGTSVPIAPGGTAPTQNKF